MRNSDDEIRSKDEGDLRLLEEIHHKTPKYRPN